MMKKQLSYDDDLTKGNVLRENTYTKHTYIEDTSHLVHEMARGAQVRLHKATDYDNGVASIKATIFFFPKDGKRLNSDKEEKGLSSEEHLSIDTVNAMCIESLDPELHEKWEDIKKELHRTRATISNLVDSNFQEAQPEEKEPLLESTKTGDTIEGLLDDYGLLPEHEIDDEAREVAVAWCMEARPMITKMELASDFMNYARRLEQRKQSEALAIAKKWFIITSVEEKIRELPSYAVEMALATHVVDSYTDSKKVIKKIGACAFLLLRILHEFDDSVTLSSLIQEEAHRIEARYG